MANTLYSDLVDEVLPHLAADPSDPVTENAIKRTVIEFCKDSWVWRYFPDPQNLIANLAEYDLEPPSGADITAILDVQIENVPITPKSHDWLNLNIPGWRTTPGTPKYYTQIDTAQIILAPPPAYNVTGAILMTAALQPSQKATGFPTWIANQYIYQIVDGAIGKLMLMGEKPWTDIANGANRRDRFEAAIANARNDGVSALGRAPVRASYQH